MVTKKRTKKAVARKKTARHKKVARKAHHYYGLSLVESEMRSGKSGEPRVYFSTEEGLRPRHVHIATPASARQIAKKLGIDSKKFRIVQARVSRLAAKKVAKRAR